MSPNNRSALMLFQSPPGHLIRRMSQLTWHDWQAQERQLTGHQNCGNCLSVADKAHVGGHEARHPEPIDARPVPVVTAASASGDMTRRSAVLRQALCRRPSAGRYEEPWVGEDGERL